MRVKGKRVGKRQEYHNWIPGASNIKMTPMGIKVLHGVATTTQEMGAENMSSMIGKTLLEPVFCEPGGDYSIFHGYTTYCRKNGWLGVDTCSMVDCKHRGICRVARS